MPASVGAKLVAVVAIAMTIGPAHLDALLRGLSRAPVDRGFPALARFVLFAALCGIGSVTALASMI